MTPADVIATLSPTGGDRVRVQRDGWPEAVEATTYESDTGVLKVLGHVTGRYASIYRDAWTTFELVQRAAPTEPAVEVGQWWADEDGEARLVTEITGDGCRVRWLDSTTDVGFWKIADFAYWTLLPDGPPEPAVGSVVWAHGCRWFRTNYGWRDEFGALRFWDRIIVTAPDLAVLYTPDGAA